MHMYYMINIYIYEYVYTYTLYLNYAPFYKPLPAAVLVTLAEPHKRQSEPHKDIPAVSWKGAIHITKYMQQIKVLYCLYCAFYLPAYKQPESQSVPSAFP